MTAPHTAPQADAHAGQDEPPYQIVIADKHFKVNDRIRTGLQLKEMAAIPLQNHLFLEIPGPGEDEQIQDDFAVPMRDGLHFYDVPVGNLGGR